jgi:hypothetical protein
MSLARQDQRQIYSGPENASSTALRWTSGARIASASASSEREQETHECRHTHRRLRSAPDIHGPATLWKVKVLHVSA